MARKKKDEFREYADTASVFPNVDPSVFGITNPAEMGYGLWLNLDRIRQQRAEAVRRGVEAAESDMPLPDDWLDGISFTPAQAKAVGFEINSQRSERRAARRNHVI